MLRTFREFVDQHDNEKHFRHELLHRLGLEDDTIKLRGVDPQKLHDTLSSMDLDDKTLNDIDAWLKVAPDSRLIDLIKQFGGSQSGAATDQQQGDQIMGQPAQLPPGQPKPKKQLPQTPLDNQPPMV